MSSPNSASSSVFRFVLNGYGMQQNALILHVLKGISKNIARKPRGILSSNFHLLAVVGFHLYRCAPRTAHNFGRLSARIFFKTESDSFRLPRLKKFFNSTSVLPFGMSSYENTWSSKSDAPTLMRRKLIPKPSPSVVKSSRSNLSLLNRATRWWVALPPVSV